MINFPITPLRRQEVLRRAALSAPNAEEEERLSDCIRDAEYVIDYKIKERNRPISLLPELLAEAPSFVDRERLTEDLSGCDALIVFTATLGELLLQEIREAEDEEEALMLRAVAAERLEAVTESYCDTKERQLSHDGGRITPHYPFFWKGYEENEVTTTLIMGVMLRPESRGPLRCKSCSISP